MSAVATAIGGSALLGYMASSDQADAAQAANDTQRAAIEGQNKIAQQQLDMAKEDRDRYNALYRPAEESLLDEAFGKMQYAPAPSGTGINGMIFDAVNGSGGLVPIGRKGGMDSPERYAEEAAKAQGETMQQYSMAMDRLRRSQGPTSALAEQRLALASAAAGANAQTKARIGLRDAAWARKIDALSLGKGLPAQASAAMAQAQNGLSSVSSQSGYMANAGYQRAGQTASNIGGLGMDIFTAGQKGGLWGPGYNHAAADSSYATGGGRAMDFSENMQEFGI